MSPWTGEPDSRKEHPLGACERKQDCERQHGVIARNGQPYKWDKLIRPRPQRRVMTVDEVKLALIVLDLRER